CSSDLLDLRGRPEDPQPIAQPLHRRARHEAGALEGVGHPIPDLPTERGQEAVATLGRATSGVHEHESPRAVGALGVPHVEAPLPEEGRLLIARDPGDREDRKSTRLNSSHVKISYAVFCLKKKTKSRET